MQELMVLPIPGSSGTLASVAPQEVADMKHQCLACASSCISQRHLVATAVHKLPLFHAW